MAALLDGAGVPWAPVDPPLTWAGQVALFAGLGVLIAPHGGALVNVALMPARSVLIELMPPLYRPTMYRDLARAAGVGYYALYSEPPPTTLAAAADAGDPRTKFYGWEPFEGAEGDAVAAACGEWRGRNATRAANASVAAHPSHMDAAWAPPHALLCRTVGKNAAAAVSYPQLADVLRQALDDIGCRDGWCAQAFGGPYVRLAGGREGAAAAG